MKLLSSFGIEAHAQLFDNFVFKCKNKTSKSWQNRWELLRISDLRLESLIYGAF